MRNVLSDNDFVSPTPVGDSLNRSQEKDMSPSVNLKQKSNVPVRKGIPKWGKRALGYALIITAFVLFFGYFFLFVPASNTYAQARVVRQDLAILSEHGRNQNLIGIRDHLPKLKANLAELKKDGQGLGWTKFMPFMGGYYSDFENAMIAGDSGVSVADRLVQITLPYADLLGLTSDGAKGSTSDRIAKLVDTMDKILPELDSIQPDLAKVRESVNKIDTDRYGFNPEIQKSLASSITYVNDIEAILIDAKPFLAALPKFLGRDKQAKYMVLFLNDKELRSGGGFISAYARLVIDKGRVISSDSSDIYKIDEKLPIKVTPPEEILKYLPEPNGKVKTHWQTRDSNVFPDFKANAEQFEFFYQSIESPDWDGIIAVDTYVVESIVRVLGSVEVGGKVFTAENDPRCNCPQVIYQLASTARSGVGGNAERKSLIGDLMQTLLINAFKDEKKLPLLAAEGFRLMNDKHVQLYMHDEVLQASAEHMGWAGRIASPDNPTRFGYEEGSWDYFYWNEANYAAEKANLFVEPKQEHSYSISGDGKITKTVKMTNQNPRKQDDFLNARYRGYFKVYVPKGSKLVRSSGAKEQIGTKEAFDKTYFDGFYELQLGGNPVTIELVYELPFKYDKSKGLPTLYQKQSGIDSYPYKISGAFGNQQFELTRDMKFAFTQ